MYPAPTPVVRALLIINAAIFAIVTLPVVHLNMATPWSTLYHDMMLYYWTSDSLEPYQLLTHFFHHADLGHVFFNMLMLYFFGPVIEKRVGPQKFLTLYFVAAAGAVALYSGEIYWQLNNTTEVLTAYGMNPANSRMLGASGAISGVLAAFAVFYPWQKLQLLFIPVPVAAVYMIGGIFALDLYMGVMSFDFDNTARFAHLGGGIAGALLAWAWKGKSDASGGFKRWN